MKFFLLITDWNFTVNGLVSPLRKVQEFFPQPTLYKWNIYHGHSRQKVDTVNTCQNLICLLHHMTPHYSEHSLLGKRRMLIQGWPPLCRQWLAGPMRSLLLEGQKIWLHVNVILLQCHSPLFQLPNMTMSTWDSLPKVIKVIPKQQTFHLF